MGSNYIRNYGSKNVCGTFQAPKNVNLKEFLKNWIHFSVFLLKFRHIISQIWLIKRFPCFDALHVYKILLVHNAQKLPTTNEIQFSQKFTYDFTAKVSGIFGLKQKEICRNFSSSLVFLSLFYISLSRTKWICRVFGSMKKIDHQKMRCLAAYSGKTKGRTKVPAFIV